jgi:hypothetical protein
LIAANDSNYDMHQNNVNRSRPGLTHNFDIQFHQFAELHQDDLFRESGGHFSRNHRSHTNVRTSALMDLKPHTAISWPTQPPELRASDHAPVFCAFYRRNVYEGKQSFPKWVSSTPLRTHLCRDMVELNDGLSSDPVVAMDEAKENTKTAANTP